MWSCPPRQIVAAVDFSRASEQAVHLAGELAGAASATLVAVHAEHLELPAYFTSTQIDRLRADLREARLAAEAYLGRFVSAHTRTRAQVRVSEGAAADVILQAAAEADLTVMGTHGRRGPGRWWLGSVAERVVRAAHVPVLVVHEQEAPLAGREVFANPGVAAMETVSPEVARACAVTLASLFGVELDGITRPQTVDVSSPALASVIVVPLGAPGGDHRALDPVATLVRSCRRPVLFIPPATGSSGDAR